MGFFVSSVFWKLEVWLAPATGNVSNYYNGRNFVLYWSYTNLYTDLTVNFKLKYGPGSNSLISKHPWKQLPKSEATGLRVGVWYRYILSLTWVCSYYIQVKVSWVSFKSCTRILHTSLLEYCIIFLSIFTPLQAFLAMGAKLGRHTTTGIQITLGIIKTKTFGSFLEGFCVIKGQFHWDPHQDYCWCDALPVVNVISKTKEVEMKQIL